MTNKVDLEDYDCTPEDEDHSEQMFGEVLLLALATPLVILAGWFLWKLL